jgi:hypothetical protein
VSDGDRFVLFLIYWILSSIAALVAYAAYRVGKQLWVWRANALGLHESRPVPESGWSPSPLSEAAIRALCVVCGPEAKRLSAEAIADKQCIICRECVGRLALENK